MANMPKPRQIAREKRRQVRDLARRRLVAAIDALLAEPPEPSVAEAGMADIYLAELRRLRGHSVYWERRSTSRQSEAAAG
jgi:hypothetical protein